MKSRRRGSLEYYWWWFKKNIVNPDRFLACQKDKTQKLASTTGWESFVQFQQNWVHVDGEWAARQWVVVASVTSLARLQPPLLASSSPVPPQPSCQLSCNYSPLLALCKQLTATADGSLLPLTARICVSFGTICTLECYSSWLYLCKRIDPVGKFFKVHRGRNWALEYQIGKFDQNREGPC